MYDIVVFSHLRWNFVYQRPQHLLSRLARGRRIYVVEEPLRCDGEAWLEQASPSAGVTVLTPHTPIDGAGFDDRQMAAISVLVRPFLAAQEVRQPVVWFYTPMALPLLDGMNARAVVYDCMDELAAFDFAPPQLLQREADLLEVADVVLTGGPSLYEAKRTRHANVHCFPSAVDVAHFVPSTPARDPAAATAAARLQGAIAQPRLGFFGVIDERLDLGLVAELAAAGPSWQVVMVGPVVKINPAHLPQAPNLHWLGSQPYALLPALVAGWDVCLLPFALNAATRFISPTKTLEYMAAEKPAVSTAVRDVAVLYGDQVRIAPDAAGFITHCRQALHETAEQRTARVAAMRAAVATTSWDKTAAAVQTLLDQAAGITTAPVAPAPGTVRHEVISSSSAAAKAMVPAM